MKLIDLTGKRFGMLTVICRAADRNGDAMWKCVCDCGRERIVLGESLRCGHTKSCGCQMRRILLESNIKHGKTNTKLYGVWSTMKSRCLNPNSASYKLYGKRGIKVCEEWANDFQAFYEWAVSTGYHEGLSIDRIDTNGNYEPSNCRWADAKMQANNRRNSHIVTLNGESHTIAEWSKITGIKSSTLYMRLNKYGYSVDDALELVGVSG